MNFKLPTIYPITDVALSKLTHVEQVELLIKGGAKLIQLRDKSASSLEFFQQAKSAIEIARKHDVKIIINDRVDIAIALKADGVHLGQNDLSPEDARKLLGKKAIIGFSTHNKHQAIEAIKLPIDYVAIGPIFATSTKSDTEAVAGLAGLCEARKAIGTFPLVAIGGLKLQHIKEIRNSGADSMAMISDLLVPSNMISEKLRNIAM